MTFTYTGYCAISGCVFYVRDTGCRVWTIYGVTVLDG